ncbi:hypothetical protein POMI540_2962 [Schizosaccharomyces pombe]|uniref:Uncharacterized protein C569.09 n=1 Tax=Schizosaccharomyces pombe (strain 972 / ATCC 24843) TaxID=284812 RepID=YQO9_SCHPO|nr:uncharacterized protein SPCC569.09 [Schizosaccharomyces pombe]C6Y4D4.1 RecName: Full=Uncharacterized protein C569.09 [Schizosaccharomyces pombe 972h-]CBA11521.1 sequence orphan [Schizosaccharomyces pombe]|eukprot:NP_001343096.1 uncharacterized protein SPCC569.09 [Schizosaccharomyces pombe]
MSDFPPSYQQHENDRMVPQESSTSNNASEFNVPKKSNRRLSVVQQDESVLNREFDDLTPEVGFDADKWERKTKHPNPQKPFDFKRKPEKKYHSKSDVGF